jgi:hypothetical protein
MSGVDALQIQDYTWRVIESSEGVNNGRWEHRAREALPQPDGLRDRPAQSRTASIDRRAVFQNADVIL